MVWVQHDGSTEQTLHCEWCDAPYVILPKGVSLCGGAAIFTSRCRACNDVLVRVMQREDRRGDWSLLTHDEQAAKLRRALRRDLGRRVGRAEPRVYQHTPLAERPAD